MNSAVVFKFRYTLTSGSQTQKSLDDFNLLICLNVYPKLWQEFEKYITFPWNFDIQIQSSWTMLFGSKNWVWNHSKFLFKGVLHPWALFFKTLCIFSKNKATSDKVSYGSGQKCSKELKYHNFTSVETIVVKLQWKMCENQYFPCFEP